MKSFNVDFNEVVPLLSDKVQNDIAMELAALLLGRMNGGEAKPRIRMRQPRPARVWTDGTHVGRLAQTGRVYRINKDATKHVPSYGAVKNVWDQLISLKASTISYEGFVSLCKGLGHNQLRATAFVGYLWPKGLIDVVEKEKGQS